MSVNQLVLELKQNDQDFEFYPTTDEILSHIKFDWYNEDRSVLDIGCGNGTFFNYFDRKRKNNNNNYMPFNKYFVIEKSDILRSKLPPEAMILGSDFHNTTLIDKDVDLIFCNPPYSEFEEWSERIILEGNCRTIYLVIPERWRDCEKILDAIKVTNSDRYIEGKFNFLSADRKARAVVDLVRIVKPKGNYKAKSPFDLWFEKTFQIKEEVLEQPEEKKFENQLIAGQDTVSQLVELYINDMNQLHNSYLSICKIDGRILKDCGVTKESLKGSLEARIKGLKTLYWKEVFNRLEDLTKRLTIDSRNKMFKKFDALKYVDFNHDNIRNVLQWAIKNANAYYDGQLITLFKELSGAKNVKPYKSNQKLFKNDGWRWCASEHSHYTLDYRLILDKYSWTEHDSWSDRILSYNGSAALKDICVIANNLGFSIGKEEEPEEFGKKYYYYQSNGDLLFEYKVYQKGTVHIKMNIELTKAINVEVGRLLGWVRSKADVLRLFDDSMQGADKYFNCNANFSLTNNNIKLLA